MRGLRLFQWLRSPFSRLTTPTILPLPVAAPPRTLPLTRHFSSRQNDLPSGCEFVPIENVEPMGNYRPGGYCTLHIGDRLDSNRYCIVHKLGHGTYATVWLAYDTHKDSYVALKVGTGDSNPKEADLINRLSPRNQFIPPLLDQFAIRGPHGKHPCYTTTIARMAISDALDVSDTQLFQLEVARVLAAQLALAVMSLHAHGLAHGDLHLSNFVFRMTPEMARLSPREFFHKYGTPKLERVMHIAGKPLPPTMPTHGVVPVWLGQDSEEVKLPNAKIFVVDFGEAFFPGKQKRFESNAPLSVRPPEARFEPNQPLGLASDIWALACSMWEVLGQGPLFTNFSRDEDDMTTQQVKVLGVLPPAWWQGWKARGESFTEAGQSIQADADGVETLEKQFESSMQQSRAMENMPVFDPEEARALLDMFRSMLVFQPSARLSISQILESEWMEKWALPAYYRMDSWEEQQHTISAPCPEEKEG